MGRVMNEGASAGAPSLPPAPPHPPGREEYEGALVQQSHPGQKCHLPPVPGPIP